MQELLQSIRVSSLASLWVPRHANGRSIRELREFAQQLDHISRIQLANECKIVPPSSCIPPRICSFQPQATRRRVVIVVA